MNIIRVFSFRIPGRIFTSRVFALLTGWWFWTSAGMSLRFAGIFTYIRSWSWSPWTMAFFWMCSRSRFLVMIFISRTCWTIFWARSSWSRFWRFINRWAAASWSSVEYKKIYLYRCILTCRRLLLFFYSNRQNHLDDETKWSYYN